eukprot:CAMPEP_0197422266 /NCGR_PEP_ID=MMETSP1170-20131217/14531_1 /TAXON_ID=54406 /ORGANISM="Sarcinochrysis sp, Strain CCMP770" /LENGTH=218 /DNA_ID=CAMNT_0042949595 /DNA_START=83 /DNA_END=739 /DNA_ORIENTATION=+
MTQTNPVPFAKALYRMIKEHPEVISWDSTTGSIVIPDPKALEKTLVEYFRHGRYASFQRQLNNFGYRRVGSPGQATVYRRWAADDTDVDLSPESILSLRHVLRRSPPAPAPKYHPRPVHPHPDFSRRPNNYQPMPPPPHPHHQGFRYAAAPPRDRPPSAALPPPPPPQQQQQLPMPSPPRPEMPPPRRLERFDSLSSIFNQPPALAAHALLSLKAQPV